MSSDSHDNGNRPIGRPRTELDGLVRPGAVGQEVALLPEERTCTSLEDRFHALLSEWRQAVRPSTTLTQLLSDPAYRDIIEMGRAARDPVVRLILQDLAAHPRHWFHALEEIAGENPVPDDAATFDQFREAWLNWGKGRGLIQRNGQRPLEQHEVRS